jgi:predicted negative regulator of RcsB-dependent stress response
MKPHLTNKKIIYSIINEKKHIINNLHYNKKNLLFNFFVILFLIILFLILLFRYFEKKNNEKNIS